MTKLFFWSLLSLLVSIYSCQQSEQAMPKPRTYPRVDFPQKEYKLFNPGSCPYSFEIPVYADAIKNNNFFNEKSPSDCWYNIYFKKFNGILYLTYYPIKNKKDLDKLINDSFVLVSKHDIKASGRKEIPIHNKNNASGLLFKIEGNVASQTQFFITDTTNNFIRGSLYFNNRVNIDSMKIIQDFIDKDISHLIESFTWK